jgi:hypothetical protein
MGLDMHLRLMGGRWRPFHGHLELSHTNDMFNIVNICYSKHERIITRSLGKLGIMLRMNITDSSTTEACLVTDLRFRKTRIK